MIIVEGPNKSGKTTLLQELRRAWKYKYLYIRDYATLDHLWYSSLTAVEDPGDLLVDRCWLTEVIYHRRCRFRLDQLYYLSLLTDATCQLLLILLPPEVELIKRGGKLNEKPAGSEFTLSELWNRYNLVRRNRLFTYTKDGYKVRVDTLLPSNTLFVAEGSSELIRPQVLRAMQTSMAYRSRNLAGVGNMDPLVLLLADRVNPNVSTSPKQRPLLPAHNGHAGAYLMRMLYWSGLDLRLVHLHNAYTPKGKLYSSKLVDILYPYFVVALGDEAHEAARTHYYRGSHKLMKLPHPQYLRRFETGREKCYGRELRVNLRYLGALAKHFTRRAVGSGR